MSIDRKLVADTLTAIEASETELLTWGLVNAQLSDDEFALILEQFAPDAATRAELREVVLRQVLVVQTPSGGYRSRMAETLRLLTHLRRTFPHQEWWEGAPLILDYRFVHRPRSRPQRDIARDDAVARLASDRAPAALAAAKAIAPASLSAFQVHASQAVFQALSASTDRGVMVTAGTGSGKTLAFYLPALTSIAESVSAEAAPAVRLLALYPRGELLKDQLRAVLQMSRRVGDSAGRPIRVGTWFGPTPRAAFWLKQGWVPSWKEIKQRGTMTGWLCPFLTCPDCGEGLVWRLPDVDTRRERLNCLGCAATIDERYITLTRERAAKQPPDVMFTTTESLNRQLAAPDQHGAFGLRTDKLRMVLLDEVHTYEGTSGAQNALLLRRLRRMVRGPVVWAGLSATLENAEEFLGNFANLYGDRVVLVAPDADDLERSGAEYLVALRHDPSSLTGPLSATIQTAMALGRSLDAPGSPYEPAPSSEGLYGRKLFVFTDKLDVTNRLYWDLLDAEGWWQRNRPKNRRILTLAHLRAEQQSRRSAAAQEDAFERDEPGQWWWLAERLGRDLDGDEQLVVGRTSSQDAGVDSEAEVIVATATLEVGYDDEGVGAVLQHKAPHDLARFVQRKGRAGRDPAMRPWTVVVLSDWGRDRLHWQLYDQLFDPQLEPRYLPLNNRYVLRMQAVYATLDWLGARLASVGDDRSAWADLAAPATLLETSDARVRQRATRQARAAALIREVLDGGPARDHLRSHLRRALGYADDDHGWADLDTLLWEPPRPVMLAVLPTALRRLQTSWAGEELSRQDLGVRTRSPLREFIAGNLFHDLLLPEVQVFVPTAADATQFEAESLPALRTLLELMPGNVTRHFGVSSFSRRHWVALPDHTSHEHTIDVAATYGAEHIGSAHATNANEAVQLFRPTRVQLAVPPEQVRDATTVSPAWDYEIVALGAGRAVDIARGRWTDLITSLVFHTHAVGDGVRVRRFARGARGSVFAGGAAEPVSLEFTAAGIGTASVALGLEYDADAVRLEVRLPAPTDEPTSSERADRLASCFMEDPRLPPDLTWFQRTALVSALTVVRVEAESAAAANSLDDQAMGDRLVDALERLGMTAADDPHALDHDGGDEHRARPHRSPMEHWCRDARVASSASDAIRNASGQRDERWITWLRARLAATAAAVFIDAACLASPELSADDLAIDVDPISEEIASVWLTEMSPGGNGQVEHLQRIVSEDPARFARLLDRALEPTEIESLDRHVRRFLRVATSDSEVLDAARRVTASWPSGHSTVSEAFGELRARVLAQDLQLSRAAWTTVGNRLVGPGAHPDLISVTSELLDRWDNAEARTGVSIGAREFGAMCHDDHGLNAPFQLEPGAAAAKRSRTISNFFWPRSATARLGADVTNPFGLLPLVDRSLLRAFLPAGPPPIAVSVWDDSTRTEVHGALRAHGEVTLAFQPGSARLARQVVLILQDDPVDVGALLLHPLVTGERALENGAIHVALAVPEVA